MTLAQTLQDIAHNFHFLRPLWLLALLPLWALAFWLRQRRSGDSGWAPVIDASLLPALRLDSAQSGGSSPWLALALCWTLAVLALAGPSWQQDSAPAVRGSAAWVVVLDLSPSMAASDLSPDRVTRARYAIDDLLSAAHDARVGLVVAGAEAFTVTPLTDDVETVRSLLPPLAPDILPTSGNNLAPALQQAGTLLHDVPGTRRIIVFSDGSDDPASSQKAASALRSDGISVDIVAVGTRSGAPMPSSNGSFAKDASGRPQLAQLDLDELRSLAQTGGGRAVELSQLSGLVAQLQDDGGDPTQAARKQDVQLTHWRDAGAWLLPALLMFAALLARRGWL
ncbi:vWA domain-containing protein [Sinimarinibacterium sp. CAU 1509]|uniref:vWA domain-containing protein n=1 Tax=Sinimarinibacterium sp. CAU 1509 TaxID=2562283 RepID=UPI00146A12C3|nr:VWA domain-containing protein [Sinimarinibacterium sp. CAU 1509]